ncbi:MAG: hypothetical protein O3A01_04735 [bacterium]|nr:hypothetical protein [bacterium]
MANDLIGLSVIILVQKAHFLELVLSQLVTNLDASVVDVIVVDASDETHCYVPSDAILSAFSDCHVLFRVLRSEPDRDQQMKVGAKVAVGDAFLFLCAPVFFDSSVMSKVVSRLESGCDYGVMHLKSRRAGLLSKSKGVLSDMVSRLRGKVSSHQIVFMRRNKFEKMSGSNL